MNSKRFLSGVFALGLLFSGFSFANAMRTAAANNNNGDMPKPPFFPGHIEHLHRETFDVTPGGQGHAEAERYAKIMRRSGLCAYSAPALDKDRKPIYEVNVYTDDHKYLNSKS